MTTTKQQKAVISARVSSREQQEEGFSLDSQVKTDKDYACKKDYKISKIFAVPESAKSSEERKTFQAMMKYVREKNIKIIICEKVDRITRNFKDAVTIDDWLEEDEEREMHFVKDNITLNKLSRSNDKLNWGVRILFAKNYIDQLKEDVRKGYDEKAQQGWFPCSKKRGYLSIRPEGQKRAFWIKDETKKSELPFIQKAFEFYANTEYSLKELRQNLYDEGWHTKDGKPIPKSTLAKILNDCFYCGKFKYKGKVYQGNHPSIISEELYQRVQDKLNGRHTKQRKHNHLFKGVMVCEECGCAVTAEIQKGHTYYHCTRHRPCSQKKFVREETIEEQILKEIKLVKIKNKKLLAGLQKALIESHQDKVDYHNQIMSHLDAKEKQLENRLDQIYLDKLDNRISLKKHDELHGKFSKEMEDIQDQRQKHQSSNLKYFELGANLLELANKGEKVYLKASPEKKRIMLNILFSNLSLEGENLLIIKQKPFGLIAQRAKNQNWSECRDSNPGSHAPKACALAN